MIYVNVVFNELALSKNAFHISRNAKQTCFSGLPKCGANISVINSAKEGESGKKCLVTSKMLVNYNSFNTISS